MTSSKNTHVRFLSGYAAKPDLLGVLAYPAALDQHDVEFTRFFMTNYNQWVQTPFDMDLVSVAYGDGDNGKCWWLLGKRGQVIAFNSTAKTQEQIADAGTGKGKLGYLSSLRIFTGRILVCGDGGQVYERVGGSWLHRDAGLVGDGDETGISLNDIECNAAGALCVVGDDGVIAVQHDGAWDRLDSPTNAHLNALCVDQSGKFCAAGAAGTVVRGDQSGFEVLASSEEIGNFWDIEYFNGELIASATAGLFKLEKNSWVQFVPKLPPGVVGYKLTACDGRLWFVGTHQVFCLSGKTWKEWQCPDNTP